MPWRCEKGKAEQDAADGAYYCYLYIQGEKRRLGKAEFFIASDEEKEQGSSVTGEVEPDSGQDAIFPETVNGKPWDELSSQDKMAWAFASQGDRDEQQGYRQTKSEIQTPEGPVDRYVKTYDDGTVVTTETLTETDPVILTEGGYYDRLDRMGGGEGPDITTSQYEAQSYPMDVMGTKGARGNPQYDSFQQGLEGYFGQEFMSYTTDQSAWNEMIKIAQRKNVSPWTLLAQGKKDYDPDADKKGGKGSGGVSYSYQEMNESDVRVLANEMSEAFIGRRVTDKEFQQLLKKVRKEESKSPTITSSSGSTTRTKSGITNAEREEVMAEILNENPEYREYQMGEAALEYTRNYLVEQKQKAAL